ncbi:MAG: HAD family hydrolase [Armatimonadota bacterium]
MFHAIIFDMDDTLVASGETWQRAEARLFALFGHLYDPRIAALYKGMNARDVGRTIYEQFHPESYTAETCGRLLREYLLESFQGTLTPMPGADALLRRVAGQYTLAIASGSPLEAINMVLDRFGWREFFSVIISSEAMVHGKPAPDVFLETARQLNCDPAEILVFEDSLHGVHAAKRAGMTCFVVPSNPDPVIAQSADRAYSSLTEVGTAGILPASIIE